MKNRMHRGRVGVAFAAAGVLLVSAFADGAAAGPGTPPAAGQGATGVAAVDPAEKFVPGELLVRFREGVPAAAGRIPAYLHHDHVNRKFTGRPGARLAAISSTSEFHSPQTSQRPAHFGCSAPQFVQR